MRAKYGQVGLKCETRPDATEICAGRGEECKLAACTARDVIGPILSSLVGLGKTYGAKWRWESIQTRRMMPSVHRDVRVVLARLTQASQGLAPGIAPVGLNRCSFGHALIAPLLAPVPLIVRSMAVVILGPDRHNCVPYGK